METSNVKIKGGPVGLDSVVVNDEDITRKVTSLSMVASGPRDLTEIHITSPVELELDIDGVVYVRDDYDSSSLMKALEHWLRTRNAGEIEEMALKSYGMNDDESITEKVLNILADMAREVSESTD